ncbi:MAG: hypothetical protein ACJA0V_003362, partial [Planctomycetota bacterium]
MKCSVRLLACVFVGWLTTACHEVPVVRAASDPAQPQNVLFVGNSFTYYNNSLHNHYRRFVRAARGPKWQGKARSILIS